MNYNKFYSKKRGREKNCKIFKIDSRLLKFKEEIISYAEMIALKLFSINMGLYSYRTLIGGLMSICIS